MANDDFPNMSDTDMPRVPLTLTEMRDMARGDLDETVREDMRQQWRGDARFSLQSVTLISSAPTLASGNVATQIPLFSIKETDEKPDFESVFSDTGQDEPNSAYKVAKSLSAFFTAAEFDAATFDISINLESGDVALDLATQLPALHGEALVLHFATAQGAEIDIVVTQQVEETPPTDTKPDEAPGTRIEKTGPAETDDVVEAAAADNTHLPDGLLVATGDIIDPIVLPKLTEPPLIPQTEDEVSFQRPHQSLTFEGDDFGRVELTSLQAREQIFFADRQEDALEARFVRDDNGVKFVVSLDGIAEQAASIFAYVPVGSDVSLYDSSGAPVSIPDAVYVYGDNTAQLSGGDEDNIILGSDAAERIRGAKGDDVIYGGDGDDNISAGRGLDQIDGGQGNDRLTGGRGNDSFVFAGRDFGDDLIVDYKVEDRIHLLDVDADDVYARFVQEEGAIFLRISVYTGPEASASVRVNIDPSVDVSLFAQDGTPIDIWKGVHVSGTAGDDYIISQDMDAQQFDTSIESGAGNDFIIEFGGTNRLDGGAGDDYLFGGVDTDVLIGGAGNDHLTGDAGSDIFLFTGAAFGHDRVWDLQSDDIIVLSDLDVGQVRARFEVSQGTMQFRILVGEEAKWTASVHLESVTPDDNPALYTADGVLLLPDEELHHLNSEKVDAHQATDGSDVFHLGGGATDTVQGYDINFDRLLLNVSDTLHAQVEAAESNADALALVAQETGLSFEQSGNNTLVHLGGETALIIEDTDDEFDFTHLDIV